MDLLGDVTVLLSMDPVPNVPADFYVVIDATRVSQVRSIVLVSCCVKLSKTCILLVLYLQFMLLNI